MIMNSIPDIIKAGVKSYNLRHIYHTYEFLLYFFPSILALKTKPDSQFYFSVMNIPSPLLP